MKIVRRRVTHREKILAAATLTTVLVGAAYVYAVEPLFDSWLDVHRRAQQTLAELAELKALVGHRDEIEQVYAQVESALTTGRSDESIRVELLRDVEQLARECGLSVRGVRPTAARQEGRFTRYGIQLSAQGESHNFVDFLQAAQRPDRLLRADRVTVIAGRGHPFLTLSFVITKLARSEGH